MNAQELIDTTRTLIVGEKGIYAKQQLKDEPIEHKQYIDKHGEDMPEIRNWPWRQSRNGKERASVVNPRL